MLKDRLALMEHEVGKLKTSCQQLYFDMVRNANDASDDNKVVYQRMLDSLSTMNHDITVVSQLLAEGHE